MNELVIKYFYKLCRIVFFIQHPFSFPCQSPYISYNKFQTVKVRTFKFRTLNFGDKSQTKNSVFRIISETNSGDFQSQYHISLFRYRR